MRYMTEDEYALKVDGLHTNWKNYRDRWHYHQKAIEWLKRLAPARVLEIGSLGIRLTDQSETMDVNQRWRINKPDIDYYHDMTVIPWPVKPNYDVVVALRCFHYCGDKLREVFDEAMRVGKALIVALPDDFDISSLPTPTETIERLPTKTNLYLWKADGDPNQVEIKAEIMTPGQARDIVEKSGLRGYGHRERIDCYKQWMLEGKWSLFYNRTGPKFINDPLIFLPDGILFEGKHRVLALSELPDDVGVPFWVLRNFTNQEAFEKWHKDWRTNQLPKIEWKSKTLPDHPRAALPQ